MILNVLILAILAFGAFRGWSKGAILTLFKLCGFVVGLIVAYLLNEQLAFDLAAHTNTDRTLLRVISFFLLWIVIPMGMTVVGMMLTKAVGVLNLGWLNRLAGAVLGLGIYGLALTSILAFFSYTNILVNDMEESPVAQEMLSAAHEYIKVVEAVPEDEAVRKQQIINGRRRR